MSDPSGGRGGTRHRGCSQGGLVQTSAGGRAERIERIEQQHIAMRWTVSFSIDVLGNPEADRLAIVSFRIKHGDKDLHYGFVVALLNDLFGIQAGAVRAGLRTRSAEHGYGLSRRLKLLSARPDDIAAVGSGLI